MENSPDESVSIRDCGFNNGWFQQFPDSRQQFFAGEELAQKRV